MNLNPQLYNLDLLQRISVSLPPIDAEPGEMAQCPWCKIEGVVKKDDIGIRHQGIPVRVKVIEGCFCVGDVDFDGRTPIAPLKT